MFLVAPEALLQLLSLHLSQHISVSSPITSCPPSHIFLLSQMHAVSNPGMLFICG
jgi:hypothetical protein